MRDLIRKVIMESRKEEWNQNEKNVSEIVPTIKKYIEKKYGGGVKVLSEDKLVYLGNDDYIAKCKVIKVYVYDTTLNASDVKLDIWNIIGDIFGIDMSRYGACLFLDVYKIKFEKV